MNIKIIVCYHKKDKLHKNNIFLPVHCGRDVALQPSKDGIMVNSDIEWLEKNMIGDNTGDNISIKNRSLNEMTAIYWVWKNYDKIGNPDYIGLNHYRRFFELSYKNLETILTKYDFIKHRHCLAKNSYYKLWVNGFSAAYYNLATKVFQETNPSEYEKFEKFMKMNINGGLCNMFVLSREDFFKYCDFIFPIVLKLPCDEKYGRYPGMFAERLTSYYLYELSKRKKAKEVSIITKYYDNIIFHYLSKIFSIKQHEISHHVVITILGIKIKVDLFGIKEKGVKNMFQVYTQEGNKELTKTLVGEFKDYDEAMDRAEESIEGKEGYKYIVEETNGCFNSYGDLVATVVAESEL